MSRKFKYRVYGLNIESEIELDELIKLNNNENNIDVTISYGSVPQRVKDEIDKTTCVSMGKNNLCVYVKDIAIYQVMDGNKIIIDTLGDINNERIKSFLLGWAFGVLFVQKNTIAFHGSTLTHGEKAFIIAGRSHSGKSTLASILIKNGYKFLSDDVAPVDIHENEIIIHPAYPQQKLCKDTMEMLGYDVKNYRLNRKVNDRERYKVHVDDIFIDKPLPIVAIFEIEVGDSNQRLEIKKMEGIDRIDCLLDNIYFLHVERRSGMRAGYFRQCLEIVKKVPVYKIIRPDGKFTADEQMDLVESVLLNQVECCI